MRSSPPRLERVRQLLRWWQERHGDPSPALEAMLDAMLRRLGDDGQRHSDIFEPSFSWDEQGSSFRRFSYAFPGFRATPDASARALLAMTAPWGGAVVAACERLVRAARHAAVAQPLLGFADDGARGRRVKVYLQFRDGASDEAVALARAITGIRVEPAWLDGSLHLLGLDLSDTGLGGVKFYVVPERPIEIADLGRPLRRTLLVHRVADPGEGLAREPTEIDFPLVDNGLAERDLLGAAALRARYAEPLQQFAALASAFELRIRRVSLGLGRTRKMTIYYVIAG